MGDVKDMEDVRDVEDVVVRDAWRVIMQCLKQEIILVYSLELWMEYNQTTGYPRLTACQDIARTTQFVGVALRR